MKKQLGYFAVLAVIFIMVIAFMGSLIAYNLTTRMSLGVNQQKALQTFYNAESGLEIGLRLLTIPGNPLSSYRLTCAGLTGNSSITNASLNGGTITVSSVNSNPYWAVTTLSSALTATGATVSIASASGFAPKGRIMIDNEEMDYNAISGSTLVNVTRGTGGTTAVAHASGAGVGQYQCTVDSVAGIPSVSSATYRQEIQNAVELQWAFAIGDYSGSSCVQGIYNWTTASPPVEGSWVNYSAGCGSAYSGSFYLSYADGWLVGPAYASSLNILHGNGDSYNFTSTPTINANLNSVFCNASNDCWTVGSVSSGNPVILHWNGTAWSRYTPSSSVNAALNSVFCTSTNSCWAVGAALNNYPLIEYWNGSTWSQQTPTAQANAALNSIYCTSSSNCWAVGAAVTSNPLIEYWNGSTWSRVTPASSVNVGLNSVYCNTSSDCWAVGNVNGSNPLIEHWTGSSWVSYTPSTSSAVSLYAVSCFTRADCWAVGQNATFVHWDSATWAYVSAPSGMPSLTLRTLSTVGPASSSAEAVLAMSSWTHVFP